MAGEAESVRHDLGSARWKGAEANPQHPTDSQGTTLLPHPSGAKSRSLHTPAMPAVATWAVPKIVALAALAQLLTPTLAGSLNPFSPPPATLGFLLPLCTILLGAVSGTPANPTNTNQHQFASKALVSVRLRISPDTTPFKTIGQLVLAPPNPPPPPPNP